MLILLLLWGLLPGRGVWCLTGPRTVTVRSRRPMSVQCYYDEGYGNYIKYWCKGPTFKSCTVQITATEHNKEISRGRFTIKDTLASRTLNVTMKDMRPGDAGTYYCGIERNLGDNMHQITVEVLSGLCHVTAPWTDIVDFPSNFLEVEAYDVVKVACKEGYQKKNITLECREEHRGFLLSARSDGDYCIGICRKAPPWTDIVDFPENFTEIAVNGSVVVSCQQRYEEKKLRLQCREGSGKFLLSPEDGQGSCVGVCRNAPPWTDIVDFPENFTEIAVNGSVVVSCQQRYEEKKLRLQCREGSGEFLLSPEDGQGSCVDKHSAMSKKLRSLLTSTIGFVVPFSMKLVVLVMMLVVKTFCMIDKRLRIYRKGPDLSTSPEERNIYVQQKSRRRQEQYDISLQQMEVQEDEDYENIDTK